MKAVNRTTKVLGAGAATAALIGIGYVGLTWSRYGKETAKAKADPLLDRFLPQYEVREYHETRIGAPADVTYRVARGLDLQQSPLVRAIFRGRELLMGSEGGTAERPAGFLEEVLALGWRILAEEPGRELVMGAVTQPWKPDVKFRGLGPEEFAAFHEPGYAKIAWTLGVESTGAETSIFRTETRVATTDPESRKLFRRYWSLVAPGVVLIRYETLKLVRREAAIAQGTRDVRP